MNHSSSSSLHPNNNQPFISTASTTRRKVYNNPHPQTNAKTKPQINITQKKTKFVKQDGERSEQYLSKKLSNSSDDSSQTKSSLPQNNPLHYDLISPFTYSQTHQDCNETHDDETCLNSPSPIVSLYPCRKVSTLIRVLSPNDGEGHNIQQQQATNHDDTLCLYPISDTQCDDISISSEFPHISLMDHTISSPFSIRPTGSHGIQLTPIKKVVESSSSPVTSESIKKGIHSSSPSKQDLILVNPDAFGKLSLPSSITIETARLVAQKDNVPSEDWIRKYSFDHVSWHAYPSLIGISTAIKPQEIINHNDNTNNCRNVLTSISKAIVWDATKGYRSSVVFTHGLQSNGKTNSMFGILDDSVQLPQSGDFSTMDIGLLGHTVSNLFKVQNLMPHVYFTISMIEILDEDVIRDLLTLSPPSSSPSSSPLGIKVSTTQSSPRIRYPDTKGAIIQNIKEENISSMNQLNEFIVKALQSDTNRKSHDVNNCCRGHIMVTLKVYHNASTSKNQSLIQLVDLASVGSDKFNSSNKLQSPSKTQLQRTASIRKSLISLRGILCGLINRENLKSNHYLNYRECTLTKLLQRALESTGSRAMIISTVCPKRESYTQTLQTLEYANRCLTSQNHTAQDAFSGNLNPQRIYPSPSDLSNKSNKTHDTIRAEFSNLDANNLYLKNLVSDPRQRLSKLIYGEDGKRRFGNNDIPLQEIPTISTKSFEYLDKGDESFDSECRRKLFLAEEREDTALNYKNVSPNRNDQSNDDKVSVNTNINKYENVLKYLDELDAIDSSYEKNDVISNATSISNCSKIISSPESSKPQNKEIESLESKNYRSDKDDVSNIKLSNSITQQQQDLPSASNTDTNLSSLFLIQPPDEEDQEYSDLASCKSDSSSLLLEIDDDSYSASSNSNQSNSSNSVSFEIKDALESLQRIEIELSGQYEETEGNIHHLGYTPSRSKVDTQRKVDDLCIGNDDQNEISIEIGDVLSSLDKMSSTLTTQIKKTRGKLLRDDD